MSDTIRCRCGQTELSLTGAPILSCECACKSCGEAAALFAGLRDGADPRGPLGTTHFVLYRKDRVRCLAGAATMAEHRLTPRSGTRRVVATCCNTPVFLELEGGHWLSLYAGMWPDGARPAAQMRTMASDLPPGQSLPADLPNSRRQSLTFMWRLATAWVAMGFRAPALDYVEGGTLRAG